MKRQSLLLVITLYVGVILAQISNYYTFAPSTGTYAEITGTPQPAAQGDDVISAAIDIGFCFNYGLNTYTQIKICSNGYVTL